MTCHEEFCVDINGGKVGGCKGNVSCLYTETYEDGSDSIGYFVKDVVQYDSVSGDFETKLANGSIVFGYMIFIFNLLSLLIFLNSFVIWLFIIRCGATQSGNLGSSSEALDGILGFGKANASVISQLASSGKLKKMFAHCLNGDNNGGGIFAIGNVVQPKVNSTHLIQDQWVIIS